MAGCCLWSGAKNKPHQSEAVIKKPHNTIQMGLTTNSVKPITIMKTTQGQDITTFFYLKEKTDC